MSGPEAFILLLRLLTTHFDRVDTGESYTRLHNFGACTGTPFCDFSREFRVLVSAVTGSERILAPGVDVVLGVVRMAVNEQFPTLIPTLHPGSMVTNPKSYAPLDAMWMAFSDLAHNNAPAVNGEKQISACFVVASAVIRPVRAPARRSWARPAQIAVPVAFMADGTDQ